MSRTTIKNTAAGLLIAAAAGTAACALDVARAAATTVLEQDRSIIRIEERLKDLASEQARIRDDVSATKEGVARIEGRLFDE
jgi:hypothetical protein